MFDAIKSKAPRVVESGMLLYCSIRGGGNRTVRSVMTLKIWLVTIDCDSVESTTDVTMFMSSVLVSRAMRCGAMTFVGSEASQSGVDWVPPPDPVGPTSP